MTMRIIFHANNCFICECEEEFFFHNVQLSAYHCTIENIFIFRYAVPIVIPLYTLKQKAKVRYN